MNEQPGGRRKGVDEADIATYLLGHPDFFERHAELLDGLSIPHPDSGAAVSLIERQVAVLRQQKQDLQHKLRHIAQSAVANEQLLRKIQALVLELLDCRGGKELVERLEQVLWDDFAADAVAIRLLHDRPAAAHEVHPDDPGLEGFDRVLGRREPVCGYLSPQQREFLFGKPTERLRSGVVIPLCEDDDTPCLGLVAVGSEDPKRFHPEMGTQYVRHLGALLAGLLRSRGYGAHG